MKKHDHNIPRAHLKALGYPNVVGVGHGFKWVKGMRTDQEALVILVNKKIASRSLAASDRVPHVLGKVPTDVIEVGEIRLLGRLEYQRPASPGVSLGHYLITAGTFGAVVYDRKTGEPMILSNNHVLANATNGRDGRSSQGDPILQPGPYDGGTKDQVIGYLERYVPIQRAYVESSCPQAAAVQRIGNNLVHLVRRNYRLRLEKTGQANLVDAALARPASKDFLNPIIMDIGPVKGIGEPRVGLKIKKSGRSSGLNNGEILVLGTTLDVNMGEGEPALFSNQVVATPMAQPGDSGSLILDEANNAVGLLFAGSDQSTIFNPIAAVLSSLDVDILPLT